MSLSRRTLMLAAAGAAAGCGRADAPEEAPIASQPALDVPYVPTPMPVVAEMVRLAELPPRGFLIDLGCGDGRIVLAAMQRFPQARGLGVDIDPDRIREARASAERLGIADRATFRQQNLFETDLSGADAVTMYLLPDVNVRLRERIFATMRPGARVVSHDFDMADWAPDVTAIAPEDGSEVFAWVVPAVFAGRWRIEAPEGDRGPGALDLTQRFQRLEGTGSDTLGRLVEVEGRVEGATARLTLQAARAAPTTLTLTLLGGEATGSDDQGRAVRAAQVERGAILLADPGARLPPQPAEIVTLP